MIMKLCKLSSKCEISIDLRLEEFRNSFFKVWQKLKFTKKAFRQSLYKSLNDIPWKKFDPDS